MSGALDISPRRLLVVMAHPDDAEFFAGAFLARSITAGSDVHLALLTDGQGGSMDAAASRAAVGALRRREQQAAAGQLGITGISFFGEEDGQLFDTWPLRRELARLIRSYRPDTLLTTDPTHFFDHQRINHPDHRAAGALALAAAMPVASVRLACEELAHLEPHSVSTFVLAAPAAPSVYAVVDDSHLKAKIRALEAHSSQFSHFDVGSFITARGRAHAAEARARGVNAELAEPFSVIAGRS